MKASLAVLIAVLSLPAFGQKTGTRQFEVASVRPSPAAADRVSVGLRWDGAQVRISSMTLRDFVGMAYGPNIAEVTGPDWIGTERYELQATLPEGAKQTDLGEMMQALLTERFQLKFHRDKKDTPVYVLSVGKGPLKLKESADAPAPAANGFNVSGTGSAAGVSVNLGNGSFYTFANNRLEGQRISMPTLVDMLSAYIDKRMMDQTGLKGVYDMSVEVTPEDYRSMLIQAGTKSGMKLPPQAMKLLENNPVPASLFDGIERQGLHVEEKKVPLDVIVVEQALQKPTEN